MANLHAIPTGGLVDPARTAAIHAIRLTVEERLGAALDLVDDFLSGEHGPIALADARNMLSQVTRELDALEHLGPPMSNRDYYADPRRTKSVRSPGRGSEPADPAPEVKH